MKQITTIYWDVDGTLLDFIYSQRYALTKCFQSIGRELTEEMAKRYSVINDAYWKRLELGEITREELLIGRFYDFLEEYQIAQVDYINFAKEYQQELGNVYRYIDDSFSICKSLQQKVQQYIVTNGVAVTQKSKLRLSGLGELMDGIFISEELGAEKPSKEFFQKALEGTAEKDKQKILLVGDSLSSDIKGGVEAGIRTCWFCQKGEKNNTKWQADYEIHNLYQIYDILKISPNTEKNKKER